MPQPPRNTPESASFRTVRWTGLVLLVAAPIALIVLAAITQRNQGQFNYDDPGHHWSPRGGLMTINTATVTYRSSFGSYPPSLRAMGPPEPGRGVDCHAAGLLDDLTVSGQKLGYVFEYIPGPPVDKHVAGCPVGAKSYVATARPLKYGETGKRSYYTDDGGCVWETTEDRPATPQDLCISWGCDNCKAIPDR